MISYGLKNFRRLTATGFIQFRPLTLLVGKNSSGKSTFLRSLPLIKQSIQTKTNSPILWYGDYVDFGSFQKTIYNNKIDLSLILDFKMDSLDTYRSLYYKSDHSISRFQRLSFQGVSIQIEISGSEISSYISRIKITVEKPCAEYEVYFENTKSVTEAPKIKEIFVNKKRINYAKEKEYEILLLNNSIFPELIPATSDSGYLFSSSIVNFSSSIDRLIPVVRRSIHGRTKDSTIKAFLAQVLGLRNFSISTFSQVAENQSAQSFKKLSDEIRSKEKQDLFDQIYNEYLLCRLMPLFNTASETLHNIFDSLLYIGPARARSERYYRHQDLSVLEIDPNGNNFPMFLNSLPSTLFEDFSNWVNSLFGYRLKLSDTEGHISINILDSDKEINVVDTGYGVSQILPVLGQIWWAQKRGREKTSRQGRGQKNTIVAIEQPELHLHPAHQALLADALLSYPYFQEDPNSTEISLLVETHSETLINRIGELISKKKIRHNDVQIVIFEEVAGRPSETTINISKFREDGSLVDWPYGFFQG